VPADDRGLESRLESDHPRPVENTRALSSRRDMFLDERGTGLRVTWHPERDLVVLSVWQDDSCVGTFRMSVQDVPRLSGLLAAALGDWVDQTGPVPGTSSALGTSSAFGTGGGSGTGAVLGTEGGPRAGGGAGAVGGWEGGGSRGGEHGGPDYGAGGSRSGMGGGGEYSLSVQQRLRLSRPVLKLRGLQHRRRRLG
jgi:hypothetical protein